MLEALLGSVVSTVVSTVIGAATSAGSVVVDTASTVAADPVPDTFGEWATLLLAVKLLATAVVNLTPTPKDDEVLAKVYRWVEVAAGILSRRAKQ